jgi:hypothetical protein
VKEETQKEQTKKEKARKALINGATAAYANDALDPEAFPIVCPVDADRQKYSPLSKPINLIMIKTINALLEQNGIGGQISPTEPFAAQAESTKQRTIQFQQKAGLKDVPGCLSKLTWLGLLKTCPFPLQTNYCHEYRPCVLAYQTMLYAFYPAGKLTGRFCKETQIQTTIFQRRTQNDDKIVNKLQASGQAQERDFITLMRVNGV